MDKTRETLTEQPTSTSFACGNGSIIDILDTKEGHVLLRTVKVVENSFTQVQELRVTKETYKGLVDCIRIHETKE